jgi:hypothetical protein
MLQSNMHFSEHLNAAEFNLKSKNHFILKMQFIQ